VPYHTFSLLTLLENKNLPSQTDLLNKLRDEMRQLDSEIMIEEARIGDFKRRTTKSFMTLKLGGLLEFAEKATVSGIPPS
jgi:hypothetical protein